MRSAAPDRLECAALLIGAAVSAASSVALPAGGCAATVSQWEQWQHVAGVFDVAGPRSDGRLVVAAHMTLSLMTTAGGQAPYAPDYSVPDGSESYIALSPGVISSSSGCSFPRDTVYALDTRAASLGVVAVSPSGVVSRLANVSGVSSLGGITLDTVGSFGHRLLVIGGAGTNSTVVLAIGCTGAVAKVATVPTALEGGIAVAPENFGAYSGELVAPNEYDGTVYAVSASGMLSTVAASGVPAGGDTGVESVGFVPPMGAALAYMADRVTTGNPHPGTDSLLRLRARALNMAGVRPGDALVGTEGGATVVDVRCAPQCAATVVARGPAVAHGEGKLLVVAAPPPLPTTRESASHVGAIAVVLWVLAALVAAALIAGVAALIAFRRRG